MFINFREAVDYFLREQEDESTSRFSDYAKSMGRYFDVVLDEVGDNAMTCLANAIEACDVLFEKARDCINGGKLGEEWLEALRHAMADADFCKNRLNKVYNETNKFVNICWNIDDLVWDLVNIKESIEESRFRFKSRIKSKSKSKSRVGVKEAEGRKISGVEVCRSLLETLKSVRNNVNDAFVSIVDEGGASVTEMGEATKLQLSMGPKGDAKRVLETIMSNVEKAKKFISGVKALFDEVDETLMMIESGLEEAIHENR